MSVRWFVFVASIVGIAASVALIFLLIPSQPTKDLLAKSTTPTAILAPHYVAPTTSSMALRQAVVVKQPTPGIPIRLTIPALKINATLEAVGRTKQGAMDVPKNLTNAAWFNIGPRPGEIGSAVIDGHSGWENDIQAVFDTLHKLHIGDTLSVLDDQGITIAFSVRELRTYAQNEDAASVFTSSDGKAHLNLVTCQGTWNAEKHSYPDRLIVFTDRVKAE